ncbi:hypothetical protein BJ170DRAFT_592377 [Xylariales sp. AK1849]|nr:hypothetical protein BJ170DRAFT_592377 [Xylariales sp. AK1849]
MSQSMASKGGIFLPIYQREALWINFRASKHKYAIKIYVGGVNAVSGKPMDPHVANRFRQFVLVGNGMVSREPETQEKSAPSAARQLEITGPKNQDQDYIVVPGQLWLDGIASEPGVIRQFVATRMGSGQSIEAQVTGKETISGIQFEIARLDKKVGSSLKDKALAALAKSAQVVMHDAELDDEEDDDDNTADVVDEMNTGAGGRIKQTIVKHNHTGDVKTSNSVLFNVQLLNTLAFARITGKPAPETPISAKTYSDHALPFYNLYEEPSVVQGDFSSVKSLAKLEDNEDEPLDFSVIKI